MKKRRKVQRCHHRGIELCGRDRACAGGIYVQAPLFPVHGSYIRRDVVEPGVYEVGRSPSVYGWTRQAVVQPGAVICDEEPSVYRTVQVRVRQREAPSGTSSALTDKRRLSRSCAGKLCHGREARPG